MCGTNLSFYDTGDGFSPQDSRAFSPAFQNLLHAMQLFFKSPKGPAQCLSDALEEDLVATHHALYSAISSAIDTLRVRELFNTGVPQLLDILIPLYVEYSFFKDLNPADKWKPSKNSLKTLRGCKQGLYTKGIEAFFQKYGDLRAVLALLSRARGGNFEVVRAAVAMTYSQRKKIVQYVASRLMPEHLETWLEKFVREDNKFPEKLPRLETPYHQDREKLIEIAPPKLGDELQHDSFLKWKHEWQPKGPEKTNKRKRSDPKPVSQTVSISLPERNDAWNGSGSQQTSLNKNQESASLTIFESNHSQDTQIHPDDKRSPRRVLISDMMNPAPRKQAVSTHEGIGERASMDPRLGPRWIPENLVLFGYCSFTCMRRHMIENLPEPFRTAIKTSILWRTEPESGGLAISNCLTIHLPDAHEEDALFVAKMGCPDAINICNLLGLGDPPENAADFMALNYYLAPS